MLKALSLALLSLFTLPVLANTTDTSFKNTSNVVSLEGDEEDPSVLHGYTYTDNVTNKDIERIFDSKELAPTIDKIFFAPSGYVYTLSIADDQINEIMDQIVFVKGSLDYMTFTYKYGAYTSEFHSDTSVFWAEGDDHRSEMSERLRKDVNECQYNNGKNRILFKTDNITTAFDLYLRFEVGFVSIDPVTEVYQWWTFVFYSEVVKAEPFNEFDYVTPEVRYYESIGDDRNIKVGYSLIPGFFNQYDVTGSTKYNEYGWLTDTTTPYYYGTGDNDYFCDYKVYLIFFDTVTIGEFGYSGGIEMSFPSDPIKAKLKLEFTSGGHDYAFYSENFIISDPNLSITVDGENNRKSVEEDTSYRYTIGFDHFDHSKLTDFTLAVYAHIDRLIDDGKDVIYCYDKQLPEVGVDGVYYYIPSDHEIELHNQGKDEEIYNTTSEGTYYYWWTDEDDPTHQEYMATDDYRIINTYFTTLIPIYDEHGYLIDYDLSNVGISDEQMYDLLNYDISIPFVGRFDHFYVHLRAQAMNGYVFLERNLYSSLEVTNAKDTPEETINLNVPNSVNLLQGAGSIDVIASLSSYRDDLDYYFDYELSTDDVIEVTEGSDGLFTVKPIHSGVVDLTIIVESSEFAKITKTVNIRVLDAIYDVAKIQVPDRYFLVGQDIDVAVNIRGFTNIMNIDVTWKVTKKNGEELPSERIVSRGGGQMTIVNPENDNYTITAYYQDIELTSLTIEVRYIDLNSFLYTNIWWIILLTLSFVALIVVIIIFTKRSKTTVEHIERVYQVFCQCLSNDSLSKEELKRIKREITRCLHRCEDLNIDALNQYEKATRYLRKSLNDVKKLLNNYDKISLEDKNVMYETLDKDLAKALSVAKEIENAKALIENYHNQANKQNYEVLKKEKSDKDSKK